MKKFKSISILLIGVTLMALIYLSYEYGKFTQLQYDAKVVNTQHKAIETANEIFMNCAILPNDSAISVSEYLDALEAYNEIIKSSH